MRIELVEGCRWSLSSHYCHCTFFNKPPNQRHSSRVMPTTNMVSLSSSIFCPFIYSLQYKIIRHKTLFHKPLIHKCEAIFVLITTVCYLCGFIQIMERSSIDYIKVCVEWKFWSVYTTMKAQTHVKWGLDFIVVDDERLSSFYSNFYFYLFSRSYSNRPRLIRVLPYMKRFGINSNLCLTDSLDPENRKLL